MATNTNFDFFTTGDEVVQIFQEKVDGRVFLITGASENSIGAETALSLARNAAPARLILPGRSFSRTEPVLQQLQAINPMLKTHFVPLDLSNKSSVEKAAKEILLDPEIERIDVLINCAGVMACGYSPTDFKDSRNRRLEYQFATNYLGPFLFTNMLLEKVRKASPGARIINISSSVHNFYGINFDDLGFSGGKCYQRLDAYAQSKTANILMAEYMASKISSREVTCLSVHPGGTQLAYGRHDEDGVIDEVFDRAQRPKSDGSDWKTLQQGASTGLVAALDHALEAHSGAYLVDCQLAKPRDHARGQELAEKLWKVSKEVVGWTSVL